MKNIVILLSLFLLTACGNSNAKKAQQKIKLDVVSDTTVVSKEGGSLSRIEELFVNPLPFTDSTNFDNFGFANKLTLEQIKALNLDKQFRDINNFYLNYRVVLSEEFFSTVISYQKGEHELYTVLVNYDHNGNIINTLDIAYDEIAESVFRKTSTINRDKVIVESVSSWEEEEDSQESTYIIGKDGDILLQK